MTSQELYEIVKDVPEAAWPQIYHDPHDGCWREIGGDQILNTDLAKAAFVGAMYQHQIDRGGWVPFKLGTRYVIADANASEFSSLVEALAAACKENPQ